MKMLTGIYRGEKIEVEFEFSSRDINADMKRNPNWKPSLYSFYSKNSQYEDYMCRHYQGTMNIQNVFPIINFYYRGHRGEKHWLTLEMIFKMGMKKEEAKEFNKWMRKVEHRILKTWNTKEWKNIRGLKKEKIHAI